MLCIFSIFVRHCFCARNVSGHAMTTQPASNEQTKSEIVLAQKKYNWLTRNYQNRLLIFGIMLTGFGIYQLPTIWTFKSDLTQLKGTVQSADTYVTTVTETRRGHKSQKAELIFYLNGFKQKYHLVENIGDDYRDDKYEKILQGLKRADSVSVWIKQNEHDEFEPQVFQIDNDKGTLLDFDALRMDKSPLTAFVLLIGLGLITVFLWFRFPDKFKIILGTNEQIS